MTRERTSIFLALDGNLLSQALTKKKKIFELKFLKLTEFCYLYLKKVLPLPRFHVYLTLVNVVNVGKIWKRTPEPTGGSRAAPHHWFLRKEIGKCHLLWIK